MSVYVFVYVCVCWGIMQESFTPLPTRPRRYCNPASLDCHISSILSITQTQARRWSTKMRWCFSPRKRSPTSRLWCLFWRWPIRVASLWFSSPKMSTEKRFLLSLSTDLRSDFKSRPSRRQDSEITGDCLKNCLTFCLSICLSNSIYLLVSICLDSDYLSIHLYVCLFTLSVVVCPFSCGHANL